MPTLSSIFLGSVLLASIAIAADQPVQSKKQDHAKGEQMSADMREAIAFQRAKDRADARQAAIEAKHPTVFYNQAERSVEENTTTGKKIPGSGPVVKK
jgi:hypothetical protein